MYAPTLGRLMQTDPIGYADGMNWYNYVGSDPINTNDPFGLKLVCGVQVGGYPADCKEVSDIPGTGGGLVRPGVVIPIFGVDGGGGGGTITGAITELPNTLEKMPYNITVDERCSDAQKTGQWLGKKIGDVGAVGTNIGLATTAVGGVVTVGGVGIAATGDLPVGLGVGFAGLGIMDIGAQVTGYSGLVTVAGATISAVSGAGKPAIVEGLSRASTTIIPSGPIKDFAQDAVSRGLNVVVPEMNACKL